VLETVLVGLLMVCATTLVQATFMVPGIRFVRWRVSRSRRINRHSYEAALVSMFTAWMFVAMVLEALIWALFYRYHPAITELPDLETAFYFSMATFTSVGYGDVVLSGRWQMLASLEGANGVIMFGWTTALIFYVVQDVYTRR